MRRTYHEARRTRETQETRRVFPRVAFSLPSHCGSSRYRAMPQYLADTFDNGRWQELRHRSENVWLMGSESQSATDIHEHFVSGCVVDGNTCELEPSVPAGNGYDPLVDVIMVCRSII